MFISDSEKNTIILLLDKLIVVTIFPLIFMLYLRFVYNASWMLFVAVSPLSITIMLKGTLGLLFGLNTVAYKRLNRLEDPVMYHSASARVYSAGLIMAGAIPLLYALYFAG